MFSLVAVILVGWWAINPGGRRLLLLLLLLLLIFLQSIHLKIIWHFISDVVESGAEVLVEGFSVAHAQMGLLWSWIYCSRMFLFLLCMMFVATCGSLSPSDSDISSMLLFSSKLSNGARNSRLSNSHICSIWELFILAFMDNFMKYCPAWWDIKPFLAVLANAKAMQIKFYFFLWILVDDFVIQGAGSRQSFKSLDCTLTIPDDFKVHNTPENGPSFMNSSGHLTFSRGDALCTNTKKEEVCV